MIATSCLIFEKFNVKNFQKKDPYYKTLQTAVKSGLIKKGTPKYQNVIKTMLNRAAKAKLQAT